MGKPSVCRSGLRRAVCCELITGRDRLERCTMKTLIRPAACLSLLLLVTLVGYSFAQSPKPQSDLPVILTDKPIPEDPKDNELQTGRSDPQLPEKRISSGHRETGSFRR